MPKFPSTEAEESTASGFEGMVFSILNVEVRHFPETFCLEEELKKPPNSIARVANQIIIEYQKSYLNNDFKYSR
jgi:hypothetical protein